MWKTCLCGSVCVRGHLKIQNCICLRLNKKIIIILPARRPVPRSFTEGVSFSEGRWIHDDLQKIRHLKANCDKNPTKIIILSIWKLNNTLNLLTCFKKMNLVCILQYKSLTLSARQNERVTRHPDGLRERQDQWKIWFLSESYFWGWSLFCGWPPTAAQNRMNNAHRAWRPAAFILEPLSFQLWALSFLTDS